jgi:CSN8/PSMD8/EIF3K family
MSTETPPREYVESLLSKGSYKISNQSTLEAYVDAQASGVGEYYFDANKALLKIYNVSKSSANVDKIATILLLALVESYPSSTDMLALSYLLPERHISMEPCRTVMECNKLLDSCQFVEFWTTLAKVSTEDASMKALVVRSTEKLQRGILQALSFTFKSANLDKVLASLNLKDAAGLTQLKEPCVESVSGDAVVFVATADNTKRNRVFQEGLSYNAIANLMAKITSE